MLTLLDRPETDGLCLIRRVRWSPDGTHLAAIMLQRVCGELSSTVLLWNPARSSVPSVLGTFPVRLKNLAFVGHGRWIATGIDCSTLRIWELDNLENPVELHMQAEPKRDHPYVQFLASKLPWVAACPADGTLVSYRADRWYRWDLNLPDDAPRSGPPHEYSLESCAMSNDGKSLVFIHSGVDIFCVNPAKDFRRPRKLFTLRPIYEPGDKARGYRTLCERVVVSGCGERFAFILGNELKIGAMAGRNRKLVTLSGHGGFISAATFGPDGRTMLTGGNDGTTRLWDVDRQKELAQYDWGVGQVTAMDLSSDGSSVVVGGDGPQNLVMWDLE